MQRRNGAASAQAPKRAIPADHIRVVNWGGQLQVLDAKGRPIPGVIAADIACRPGAPPLMRLNLAAGIFDIDGVPAYGMLDPRTNRFRPIKRVEFADGPDDFEPTPAASPAPPVSAPQAAAPIPPEAETSTDEAPSETDAS